ncbi:CDP-diacylglycerol--glycerol-3-phosphate 3-phosphatidyltransferase [Candidatus Velamenicoccus archaeovorus]|uniref:CDP-diacylglycerol--glycerol-3-phosphate 3-phosphatidyltransferase n=1 Tax=Velamenicoccus archaeovorus TaxID=1930593 RepID=A0A410P5B2_VELA1|nr:CDP-diacylglycerol--glycerol-3-phosphate 3-phosphatidyltransferase [Candidatus Velamenicoccus archaeovorus]QAT17302.1 CDP-diacylglycerol--glycerol-3-phosphate 3-phosphatidyltransferase [Candidatus Velamenicoccus archaeovorus]
MNLPNYLTLSRIVLTFVIMAFLFAKNFAMTCAAFLLFLAACATDFLDGWVARKKGLISDFGKIMDPLADKVLVVGLFLTFVQLQLMGAWVVVVIVVREFLITGMRIFALRRGVVLAAESAGKHKTVSQMGAIICILIFLILRESGSYFSFWNETFESSFRMGIHVMVGLAVFFTVYSGLVYLWRNRHLIRTL